MSRRLEVLLHGESVGEISEGAEGGTEFRFLERYFDLVPRPVLGQKFEDDLARTYRSRAREQLPDFFANLIPEGRLRELVEETTSVEAGDDLALLAHLGGDLPGAVAVRPFAGEDLPSEERPREPGAGEEEVGGGLRFSLAGVQLKLSLLRKGEKLALPMPSEAGDWIAKLDSPSFPHLPENEYSMLEWARAAGFDVPECRLHHLDDLGRDESLLRLVRSLVEADTRVLAIRRYDRSSESRIHQEDFAQAVGLPAAKKYDQIRCEDMVHLVRRFVGEEAVDEYVRRLVFVVASGNGDAHLKNWSLVYPDRIRAAWAPLYDQVATVAWPAVASKLSLKLAGVKDFAAIDRRAFRRLGEAGGVAMGHVDRLVDETLERSRAAWQEVGDDLPLVPAHREALAEHWRRVPLLEPLARLG